MSATLRPIKSFVKRESRLTTAQAKSLQENWPFYGLDHAAGMIEPQTLFQREAPLMLEIGFGMGASLCETLKTHPEINVIGIEVHRPGVGAFLREVKKQDFSHVRVYCHDAVEVCRDCLPKESLDRVCIFFPDPWPKKRHHKRRLIQAPFLSLLIEKLKSGGVLHVATDWEPYAIDILSMLQQSPLVNTSETGDFVERPSFRPKTKYEIRGERLGHPVRDLIFQKTAG